MGWIHASTMPSKKLIGMVDGFTVWCRFVVFLTGLGGYHKVIGNIRTDIVLYVNQYFTIYV